MDLSEKLKELGKILHHVERGGVFIPSDLADDLRKIITKGDDYIFVKLDPQWESVIFLSVRMGSQFIKNKEKEIGWFSEDIELAKAMAKFPAILLEELFIAQNPSSNSARAFLAGVIKELTQDLTDNALSLAENQCLHEIIEEINNRVKLSSTQTEINTKFQ